MTTEVSKDKFSRDLGLGDDSSAVI